MPVIQIITLSYIANIRGSPTADKKAFYQDLDKWVAKNISKALHLKKWLSSHCNTCKILLYLHNKGALWSPFYQGANPIHGGSTCGLITSQGPLLLMSSHQNRVSTHGLGDTAFRPSHTCSNLWGLTSQVCHVPLCPVTTNGGLQRGPTPVPAVHPHWTSVSQCRR